MSEELKALRRIKDTLWNLYAIKAFPHGECPDLESYLDDIYHFRCIETALNEKANIENRLDEIFENHNIKSLTELNERLCDYNELKFDDDIKQKKLKALEIIKKYTTKDGINIDFKKILKWNGDYDEKAIKEFDLLKEVLK